MTGDDHNAAQSRGSFFGRRKGHKLRAHRAALFETLMPRLALDISTPVQDLETLFPNVVADVRLEIGFGGAEHLIAQAQEFPDIGFIGSEPFIDGMAKALAEIERHGLDNIRLHDGDASFLLDWLPAAALGRVDLLYPDPWPKTRHWKRRFVQAENISRIARVLRPGGEFRFASDISGYSAWTLERLTRSDDFRWTAERADDWRKPWDGFGGTRYEAKAKREGRAPCYLTFERR